MSFNNNLGASAWTSATVATAKALVPWRTLQQQIRAEFTNITTSRQRLIPLIKAIHEQWQLGQTDFDKWADLVSDTFGKSKSWAYNFLNEIAGESGIDVSGNEIPFQPTGNTTAKEHEKGLSQVDSVTKKAESRQSEKSPVVKTVTADEWEKKERYTIQDPPKPRAKPNETGKPKKSLAIWAEIEGSLFGRALNRLDELNRVCPNPAMHSWLITHVKECMAKLDQWKQVA